MHWNLNYITNIWYKNSYTLKDSIYTDTDTDICLF